MKIVTCNTVGVYNAFNEEASENFELDSQKLTQITRKKFSILSSGIDVARRVLR